MSKAKPPAEPNTYVVDRQVTKVGLVVGSRPCKMACCRGTRLSVRWAPRRITYVCTEGMKPLAANGPDVFWKII